MEQEGIKMIITQSDETPETNELLRFNMLSRKAILLTSKGLKREELMTYLDEEFNRMDEEALEEQDDSTNDEEQHSEDIVHLEDSERIKNKVRPKKPVRLKTIVEEIREKMATKQAKKNKKPINRSK